MLNDLKDWAVQKGDETRQMAEGVASEVQHGDVMEWSGTVWILIGAALLIAVLGFSYNR